MRAGTDAVGLSHSPILTDTITEAAMTPTQAVPGHTTGTAHAITEALHDVHTQMPIHIALTVTLHIEDHLPIGALQVTLETAANHDLKQHTNQLRKPSTNLPHSSRPQGSCITEEIQVTIDDPQMDFYSSDDHSSDSEEDLDHLN